jgi:hypothetical protein
VRRKRSVEERKKKAVGCTTDVIKTATTPVKK